MKKQNQTDHIPVIKTDTEYAAESIMSAVEEQSRQNEAFYRKLAQAEESGQYPDELDAQAKAQAASLRRSMTLLQNAFIRITVMTDELKARFKDADRKNKSKILRSTVYTNTQIDYEEEKSDYFARGNNAYKLMLVLIVTSFIGVIVETIWCYLRRGVLESRAGLVYGPFNLVYGFGGMLLTGVLYRWRNHGSWLSFVGGFFTGSFIEYICSFVQEKVFGSVSWDYSSMPLNINGRICLLYSVFWGLLGMWWIKSVYPFIAKWLLKIPNKTGKIITVAVMIFLAGDSLVSAAAVYRWSQRDKGKTAVNVAERLLDARFTDKRMKKIYPSLVFSAGGDNAMQ